MCFSLQNKTHHNSQTSPLVVQICVYQLIVRNLGPPGKRYERFYLPLSFVAFSFLLLLLLLLLLFLIPFTIFALLFLSLLVVTQTRGHIAGSSLPLLTTVHVLSLAFLSREGSALSSLVDSRRTVLTHAT